MRVFSSRCFAPLVCVVLLAVPLGSASALASERTGLAFTAATYQAEYSQAVSLELALVDKDGDALDGTTACGAGPCRVTVTLVQDAAPGTTIQVTQPDVAVDAAGRARVRLTLVDGRHGGATFVGDDVGVPYTLTARFRGAGGPLPDPDDVDCQPEAAGTPDGRLCPSTNVAPLLVKREVPDLSFNQDVVMGLGDQVTLAAEISDRTGDADAAGEEVDGPGPKLLEGLPVRFFYDVDDDGRPSLDELLGEALTNSAGVAAFEFTADPSFAQAGVYDAGLHAEFPGDDRYSVARTSVALTIEAGGPDPEATIIEVDPKELDADGVSEATIRVRLVDGNGNLLGPEAPEHEVVVTTTLGLLIDEVERDALDGTYTQQLRVQRKGGTAQLAVTVDGEDAGTARLLINGPQGCTCADTSPSSAWGIGAALLLLLRSSRRRRRDV